MKKQIKLQINAIGTCEEILKELHSLTKQSLIALSYSSNTILEVSIEDEDENRYEGQNNSIGYYRKRYVLVNNDNPIPELWANEYFTSVENLLEFTRENDIPVNYSRDEKGNIIVTPFKRQ